MNVEGEQCTFFSEMRLEKSILLSSFILSIFLSVVFGGLLGLRHDENWNEYAFVVDAHHK